MKRSKTKLDEMQLGILQKIEEKGVWLAFWSLLAAILVQLLCGAKIAQVAGEIAVFALLSAYIAVMKMKNGLWAPTATPSMRSNVLVSIGAAVAIGVILALKAFVISHNVPEPWQLGQLAATMAVVGIGCFFALEGMRRFWRKRRGQLDNSEEDEKGGSI